MEGFLPPKLPVRAGEGALQGTVGHSLRARVDGDGDAGVGPAGWVPSLIESSGDFVQPGVVLFKFRTSVATAVLRRF